MSLIKQIVGIDISSTSFDARFGTINTQQQVDLSPSKSFKNSLAGFKRLLLWTKKLIVSGDVP
jgi:transposase